MHTKPYTIAITGGIASGKSRIACWLKNQGLPVIDADEVARQITRPHTPVFQKIIDTFGVQAEINGELNRAYLRKLIFSDSKARQKLEAITHPTIHTAIKQQLNTLKSPLAFVELPLLAEIQKPDYIDEIWVADCPETIQLQRCMARGLDQTTCLNIIQSQATRKMRYQLADHLINTHCDWSHTCAALKSLLLQKHNTANGPY